MSVYVNGREVFNNSDINNPDIDGGTIDNAAIASGTLDGALLGATKTNIQKGPAIINSGFAGTVTAAASTTVTFSSAADAILAGYDATNPILGTTLISNALTRSIVSWTNSTTCVVQASVTWAGTAITSVQYPIATFVNSAGVTKGWILASGNVYFPSTATVAGIQLNYNTVLSQTGADLEIGLGLQAIRLNPTSGNILTGSLTAAGTSAAKVLAMGSGTAPSTSPADAAQMWVADQNGVAGKAALHLRDETGVVHTFGANVGIATTAPTSTIHSAGSFALPITTKTADYTAGASDYTILVSCSSANITITLPAASGCSGRIYNVKKIDATGYTVTVDGNSSETIDGALTQVISTQYESLQIQSSGSVWYLI